ncbi:uncharacterized protein LOC124593791 [Schistocerca americana]|uniref:uncharacterized protein LOC124593791 n=1 Tax=Schistocerca americana TaxID=7009 RepID=UPI001F4F2BF8|nr:uncharacterized protein LOC124593791 [Schistocerca americana]
MRPSCASAGQADSAAVKLASVRRRASNASSTPGTPRQCANMEDQPNKIDVEKVDAIDTFIAEIQTELKAKKVSLTILSAFRNKLIGNAVTQARLEGQIQALEKENARLRQQVEIQTIAAARHDLEATDSLIHARLEGQIDILKDENNKLSVQVEEFRLENFTLKRDNQELQKELDEAKTIKPETILPAIPTFAKMRNPAGRTAAHNGARSAHSPAGRLSRRVAAGAASGSQPAARPCPMRRPLRQLVTGRDVSAPPP